MTYRERLSIEKPEAVGDGFWGGCLGCPHNYGYGPEVMGTRYCVHDCKKCWDRIIPPSSSSIVTTIKPQIDISALINEAMEKKDRQVYILCYDGKMTIDVKPYTASDPRWIVHDDIPGRGRRKFECSECHGWSSEAGSYCQFCGEKLRMPIPDDFKKEEANDS